LGLHVRGEILAVEVRLGGPGFQSFACTRGLLRNPTRLEALYVLAVHTGMRQGELLALRWDDVDLEATTVRVRGTKTARSRRTVRLSQAAADALKSHLAPSWRRSMVRAIATRTAGSCSPPR
jgi:integrase